MYVSDNPVPYNPVESAGSEFQQEAPSTGEAYIQSLGNSIAGKTATFAGENLQTGIDALANKPKVPAADINAQAPIGNDGKPTKITDSPMYQDVADMLIKDKRNELETENAMSRYRNSNGLAATLAVGGAAFMSDPLAAVATSYGGAVLGASKVLEGIGALGIDTSSAAARVGARAVSGAVGSPVSMAPLIAAQYGIGQYQNSDYDLHAALNDFAFASVAGAIGHAGFGAASEAGILKPDELMKAQADSIIKSPAPIKEAAINSTIADVVNGRPADTQSVIGKDGEAPNLDQFVDDRTRQNADGFSPSMTSEEIGDAKKEMIPDGVKVEPKPPIAPEVIDHYQKTVTDELAKQGVTGISDDVAKATAQVVADARGPEAPVKVVPQQAVEIPAKSVVEDTTTPYSNVPPKPQSLTDWVRQQGGIKDEGGDISASIGGSKGRPGVINKNGNSIDDLALRAHEAGYFHGEERPDVNTFKDKLAQDHNGKPQYSIHDQEKVEAFHNAIGHNAEIDRMSHELGIDTKGKTHEQFWNEVSDRLSEEQIKSRIDELEHKAETLSESWRTEALEPEELEAMELENARKQKQATETQPIGDGRGGEPGPNSTTEGRGEADVGRIGSGTEPSGRANEEADAGSRGDGNAKPDNVVKGSVIGGGDALDMQIAQAERSLDISGMTADEQADLKEAYKQADLFDNIYAEKLKDLIDCFTQNGV